MVQRQVFPCTGGGGTLRCSVCFTALSQSFSLCQGRLYFTRRPVSSLLTPPDKQCPRTVFSSARMQNFYWTTHSLLTFCLQWDHQELPLAQIHWAAIPESTVSAVCAAGGAAPFTSKLRQFGAWYKTCRTVTSSTSLHLHALPQHHLLLFYVRSLYYFFTVLFFATVLTESFTYHLLTKKKVLGWGQGKGLPRNAMVFQCSPGGRSQRPRPNISSVLRTTDILSTRPNWI